MTQPPQPDSLNHQSQSLETRFDERMERVGQRLEESADFLGTASEMAIASQNKIDALGDKIDRMVELEHERDLKWDTRIAQLTESINRQQSSIDRMTASIEAASTRQENVLMEYQKTAQSLIQLATAMMQQKAG